jgi:hypothetical protein
MKMTEGLFLTDPHNDIIINTCEQRSIGALYCYNLTQYHCNFTVAYKEMLTYTSLLETKLVI